MSERETILDQAMKAFVAAHRAGTLSSVPAFIQNYPAEEHEPILDFIEEYLEMEAELATMDVDPTVLAAVDTARERVLEELAVPRVSLRELRKQAGLLPARLAQIINLPTAVVGHLESGRIILASLTRRQSELAATRRRSVCMTTRNDRAAAISHPVPAADTLDFWADELASGRITWDQFRQHQADVMPRCACGHAAVCIVDGAHVCARCYSVPMLVSRGVTAMRERITQLQRDCAQLDTDTARGQIARHLLDYWQRQAARYAGAPCTF